MKLSLDKTALLFIPYLLLLSICYDNGYWSMFSISVFNYYEAQDLLKDISGPIFRFGGLTAVPLLLSFMIILTWANKKEELISTDAKPAISRLEVVSPAQPVELTEEQIKTAESVKLKISFKFHLEAILEGVKILLQLLFFMIIFIIIIFLITAIFFPFEEEGSFLIKYLNSLNKVAQLRFIYATSGSALIIGTILPKVTNFDKKEQAKCALLAFSFVFTLFTAYHYGKVEAYKIVAGTEFRYWIDRKGVGYKYLSKINKHYFFLKDVSFINHRSSQNYSLDTLDFNPAIRIITDDSLKSVELDYYGPRNYYNTDEFKKIFNSRNGEKLL